MRWVPAELGGPGVWLKMVHAPVCFGTVSEQFQESGTRQNSVCSRLPSNRSAAANINI